MDSHAQHPSINQSNSSRTEFLLWHHQSVGLARLAHHSPFIEFTCLPLAHIWTQFSNLWASSLQSIQICFEIWELIASFALAINQTITTYYSLDLSGNYSMLYWICFYSALHNCSVRVAWYTFYIPISLYSIAPTHTFPTCFNWMICSLPLWTDYWWQL